MLSIQKEDCRKRMALMNTASFASQLPIPLQKINRYIVVQYSSYPTNGDVIAFIDGEEMGLICRSSVATFQGWDEKIECDTRFVRAVIDRFSSLGFWELNDFVEDSDTESMGHYYILVQALDCKRNREYAVQIGDSVDDKVGDIYGVDATMFMPLDAKMTSVRNLSRQLYRLIYTPKAEFESRSRLYAKGLGWLDPFISVVRTAFNGIRGKLKPLP